VRGADDLAVPPAIEPYPHREPSPPPGRTPVALGELLAAILQKWAADSVVQDQPAELPPRVVA
jgi:hypothetical protein